jgi:hypothetical protein
VASTRSGREKNVSLWWLDELNTIHLNNVKCTGKVFEVVALPFRARTVHAANEPGDTFNEITVGVVNAEMLAGGGLFLPATHPAYTVMPDAVANAVAPVARGVSVKYVEHQRVPLSVNFHYDYKEPNQVPNPAE